MTIDDLRVRLQLVANPSESPDEQGITEATFDSWLDATTEPATVADLIEVAKTLPGAEVINRFGVHPDGTEFLRGQSLVIPLTEGVA